MKLNTQNFKTTTDLGQPPVSGSLQDRLFELANDFALAKQGNVAVKLHSIHNELRQPPVSSSVCAHRHIMHINSKIAWLCLDCRKFSDDKQTFR